MKNAGAPLTRRMLQPFDQIRTCRVCIVVFPSRSRERQQVVGGENSLRRERTM
jgi:hypothetical protein